VGKSVSPRDVAAAAPVSSPTPAATSATPIPTPLPVATIKRGKQPTVAPGKTTEEPPLFATPVPKKIYIQMAAVEKGLAMIFAEGLRRRGLDGFVAPGPNEKLFRVLIGPLPDEAAYKRVKNEVDQIGLNVFPRRYEQ
jgi:cell division septation protein DedD